MRREFAELLTFLNSPVPTGMPKWNETLMRVYPPHVGNLISRRGGLWWTDELDGPSMRKLKAGEAAEPPTPPVATIAADGKLLKGARK